MKCPGILGRQGIRFFQETKGSLTACVELVICGGSYAYRS